MREWQAGDVAVATVRGVPNVRIMRSGDTRPLWRSAVIGGVGVGSMQWHSDEHLSDLRPLVVIDPEDREQVRRLYAGYVGQGGLAYAEFRLDYMQAALRSLVAPAKPEEPTGLGAVVLDSQGTEVVHIGDGIWTRNGGPRAEYALVDAVKVLSEGVQ